MSAPAPHAWTWRGRSVVVPYVAAWSSERAVVVREDPLIGGHPATFWDGERLKGRPIFGKMASDRQRRSVVQGLCQVCAAPLGPERWVVLTGVQFRTFDAGEHVLLVEPWTCAPCTLTSIRTCPHLERAAKPRLEVGLLRSWDLVLHFIDPFLDGRNVVAVDLVKIRPRAFAEVISCPEWVARHAPRATP